MADVEQVQSWVERYRQAWESNDPDEIGGLFTEDATYRTAPFDPPRRGVREIVDGWLEDRDEAGTTTFTWSVLVDSDELVVVEGTTLYPDRTYSNLFLIALDEDGRCTSFTEWYMKHPEPTN